MGALAYLYRKTFKNRVKTALKKPITYLYIALAILYAVGIGAGLVTMAFKLQIDSPKGLFIVLSILVLFMVPSNILTYAKRKGLIFKPSDTHFVFTAPIRPKLILIYAQVKQYLISFLMIAFVTVAGTLAFQIEVWKMLVYFFFAMVVESILETSIMILLYGNERFSEKTLKAIGNLMWLIVISFAGYIAYMIYAHGMSLSTMGVIAFSPVIQCIPIIGWNIAVINLLMVGPTTVNIVCTGLYCISTIVLFVMAKRMKCTGGYFEDAAKFADDYQETRRKSKKGEVALIGKKKKYGKASITYKGSYAKAIYYRQLLEYKKNRFFIFGMMTLVSLGAGIVLAVLGYKGSIKQEYGAFVIVGAAAYLCFCFSAYATKWTKEMENPYTFLIPDTPFRKLWYATKIEHIRSLIDGCLIAILPGIVFRIGIVKVVLIVLIYVCIQANKLYANILSEAILGNLLGATGKQVTRMIFQGAVFGMGAVLCMLLIFGVGVETGFLALVIYSFLMTFLMSILASALFSRMESGESI